MKINVLVKPNAKQRKIEEIDIENYHVWIKATPKNNLANLELIFLLAKFFNTSEDKIKIIKGQKTRKKIVVISI